MNVSILLALLTVAAFLTPSLSILDLQREKYAMFRPAFFFFAYLSFLLLLFQSVGPIKLLATKAAPRLDMILPLHMRVDITMARHTHNRDGKFIMLLATFRSYSDIILNLAIQVIMAGHPLNMAGQCLD